MSPTAFHPSHMSRLTGSDRSVRVNTQNTPKHGEIRRNAATSDNDSCDAADIRSPSPQPKKARLDEPAASTAPLQFQDITQLLDTLRTTTDVSTGIPCGPKNSVRFVTSLSIDERTGRASYADDCGAWNAKTSTTTCTSFAVVDDRLLFVKLRDGIYCRGGRKGVWHPLQPQPQAQDVVRAHRHYATLVHYGLMTRTRSV